MNQTFAKLRERVSKPDSPEAPKILPMTPHYSRAGEPRPYAGDRPVVNFPPVEICIEIQRRDGKPKLVTPEQLAKLAKIQKGYNRVSKEIQNLDYRGIAEHARRSRSRLAKGRGNLSDHEFSKSAFIAGRKALKKQRAALVERARPELRAIAESFQAAARRVLGEFEAEISRVGLDPANAPTVQQAALACWAPVELVETNLSLSPKQFLKKLGIKL